MRPSPKFREGRPAIPHFAADVGERAAVHRRGGVSVGYLEACARAASNIGGLERWGWIIVGDATGGRRDGYGSLRGVTEDTVLRPTRARVHARRLWPRVLAEVEQRWRARFGTEPSRLPGMSLKIRSTGQRGRCLTSVGQQRRGKAPS
jgi:hypothetical protein